MLPRSRGRIVPAFGKEGSEERERSNRPSSQSGDKVSEFAHTCRCFSARPELLIRCVCRFQARDHLGADEHEHRFTSGAANNRYTPDGRSSRRRDLLEGLAIYRCYFCSAGLKISGSADSMAELFMGVRPDHAWMKMRYGWNCVGAIKVVSLCGTASPRRSLTAGHTWVTHIVASSTYNRISLGKYAPARRREGGRQ